MDETLSIQRTDRGDGIIEEKPVLVKGSPQIAFHPPGYVKNAKLRWTGVSSVNVGVVVGVSIVRCQGDTFTVKWTGFLAGNMPADLDAGVEANDVWYAVHVIGDTSGVNPPKVLFSLPASAPTLPVGYDVFRRIGWVKNDASGNFLKFLQRFEGQTRRYWWDEGEPSLRLVNGGTATIFTAVDLSPLVPPTAENVILLLSFTQGTLGILSDDLQIRSTGSLVLSPPIRVQSPILTAAFTRFPGVEAPVNNAQSLDYKVAQSGISKNAAHITVQGFDDEL